MVNLYKKAVFLLIIQRKIFNLCMESNKNIPNSRRPLIAIINTKT